MQTLVTRALSAAAIATLVVDVAHAQKPEKRVLVPVSWNMSTPARGKVTAAWMKTLRVPAGFTVSVFTDKVASPRVMAVGTDGTIYITRRDSGDVIAVPVDASGSGGTPRKVVANLPTVHGITLHNGTMYLATNNEVYAAAMRTDGSVAEPRAIVTGLPDAGQHPNRTLGVGPDGWLYITVGSTCNQCNEANPQSATIHRARLDGTDRGVFASGLRNTIGFGWHPVTKELWGMDHGTDLKGNDVPPEELNLIQSSSHYGWPYCYANKYADSTWSGEPQGSTKQEFCPRTVAPTLMFTAHSAPLQMAFYTADQFPTQYRNDAFVAMRGSWNRQPASGHRVVRIHFEDNKPVRIEDFMTGFLSADGNTYYGRPVGLVVAKDGSLLLSDDTNGMIYRIAYTGAR